MTIIKKERQFMTIKDPVTVSHAKEESKTVNLGIATTPEEKLAIYRFRYHIYAEEMSKRFPNMDHINKLLYDELDDWGVLLYAKSGSDIIGTLRINIGFIADFSSFWVQALSLKRFAQFNKNNQKFAYTSKFMVSQSYRNSTVPYLLSSKSYELCCKHQIQFNFGVCTFHLLRLYEQFGFRRFGRNFVDDGYGLLAPYVLLVDDIEHLRAVHSPFYRQARKRAPLDNQATKWFDAEFTESSNIINSQLVCQEDLWRFLYARFGASPAQAIPILQGLSDVDAIKFIHCCGVVVQCHPDDHITFQGDTSYALNILISGHLKSLNLLGSNIHDISPGQSIGANGLVNHPMHTEDIIAVTDAEILVLSSLAFPKFCHSYPDIANKIMQNKEERTDSNARSNYP
jgi:predicted GNAT family N-acyltransferase